MSSLRLGDEIDDYCVKCKRVTNHSIVSLVENLPAKVRCRACYAEQSFRNSIAPPTKKELKQAELMAAMLAQAPQAEPAPPLQEAPKVKPRRRQ